MQYNVGVLWLVNKLGNNILFMGRLRLSAVWLNDGANFLASGPYIWETQKLQWMFRKLVVITENIGQGFAKEMFLTNAGWQCSVTNFALGTPGTHWELHTSQVATVIYYRTCEQSRTEVIQIHWWVTTAFALHSCLVFFFCSVAPKWCALFLFSATITMHVWSTFWLNENVVSGISPRRQNSLATCIVTWLFRFYESLWLITWEPC